MRRHILRLSLFAFASLVGAPSLASAAQITYSGRVDGKTVPKAFVIAATFAPSFTDDYFIRYGDAARNLAPDAFVRAAADGNLIPIGAGTLTATDGTFSASGSTAAPLGTSIFLFAFDATEPIAVFQVIATSTLPNWHVATNDASLLATQANVFEVGGPTSGGVELASIPIPEPAALAAIIGVSVGCAYRARNRRATSR